LFSPSHSNTIGDIISTRGDQPGEGFMRLTAALLCVLCTAVAYPALATDPEPPAPSSAQKSPAPAEPQSAAAPAGEQSAAPPAKLAVAPTGDIVEITRREQELLSQGYKVQMRHGEKYFCHRESIIGSHFDTISCNTAESIQSKRASGEEVVRKMQANKPQISN
jgi:hypothetical protein